MSARHFEYDKHTSEMERSGCKKNFNENKDYIETMTTLDNKTYHQTKLNKAKAKFALLNKNKNPNFHKNTQVQRAKREQKGEIHLNQ